MREISSAFRAEFKAVRFILTDMDETLTFRGRLSAATFRALERLRERGIKVIPVTAAPAGWCDQMARMWPVDGVIGENGGLYYQRDTRRERLIRSFWHSERERADLSSRLQSVAHAVEKERLGVKLADDQPFRVSSLAFEKPEDELSTRILVKALKCNGASATVNNLWVLGWLGGYDKLSMARRVLWDHHGLNIDTQPDSVLYVGDSTNDAPMFEFFRHTVGVSTVHAYLHDIPVPPRWVTQGPGGAGFVETVEAVLASQ